MPLYVAADQKSHKRAASLKRIIHHLLRIDQKLSVNIVHRIGLQNNVCQRYNHQGGSRHCEKIDQFLISIQLLLNGAHNENDDCGRAKPYHNILRSVHAQEIP